MQLYPLLPALLLVGTPALRAGTVSASPNAPPGSIAGEWGVEIEAGDHPEQAVLRFTLENAILTGTFAREGSPPRELANLRFADGRISFDIEEVSGTLHATGTVYERLMTGKLKPKGEGGPSFSLGGRGDSGSRAQEMRSRKWTAYRRPDSPPPPAPPARSDPVAAPPPETDESRDPSADHRFHVSYGALAGSEVIRLTPSGEATAFTASFSLPDGRFHPDPYAGRCRLVAAKSTLKREDQESVLGREPGPGGPESDDPLVLHPSELRNAATRFGANAVYLLLSESEALENAGALHDCTIVSKDGSRYRGEYLEEISCRNEAGKSLTLSRYGGRASFYSCPPTPAGRHSEPRVPR